MRALAELAHAGGGPLTVADIAAAQDIPARFLQNILLQLRQRSLVLQPARRRRADTGWPGPPGISLADILRAVDGPLAAVRGERRSRCTTTDRPRRWRTSGWRCGSACATCVEEVTPGGPGQRTRCPTHVAELVDNPDAWVSG